MKIHHSKKQRILLLLFGGIGDLLLFTPALEALSMEFPHATIDAVVRNHAGERILRDNPSLNKVYVYNRKNPHRMAEIIRLLVELRRQRPAASLTICVDFDYKTAFLALLSGAPQRIGPYVKNHGFFYNRKITFAPEEHYIYRNYDLVSQLGVKGYSDKPSLKFYLNEKEREYGRCFFARYQLDPQKPVIGIQPGGGKWRPVRRWPTKNFTEMINLLIMKYQFQVILMGGPDETDVLEEIIRTVTPRIVVEDPGNSLGHSAAIIERCRLFVCNDGGFLHLAAALNTPTLSLFGPTSPAMVAPIRKQHVTIKNSSLRCSPCIDIYDYKSDGCKEKTCMYMITTEEVIKTLLQQLQMTSPLNKSNTQ